MGFRITPRLLQEDSILNEHDRSFLRDLYLEEGDGAWEAVAGDGPLDERRLARNSHTLGELEQQPQKIRETLLAERDSIARVAQELCADEIRTIYLVGCGDSLAALRGERFMMESLLHIPCHEEDPLDFVCYNSSAVDGRSLVIALSSSGRTIRIVEALLKARALGAKTVALTNSPDSPLAQIASCKLLVHASRKGWPTQSSTSAMAVVAQLAIEMARCWGIGAWRSYAADFVRVGDLMVHTIAQTRSQMRRLAGELLGAKAFFFCGAGPFYTCAEYGAAKVKEATPSYAMAVELEEFHHYNTVKAGDPLFVVAPPGESPYRALETVLACRQLGGIAYVLTNEHERQLIQEADEAVLLPDAPECFANFVYAIPLQQFGCYLAQAMERLARARALEEIA